MPYPILIQRLDGTSSANQGGQFFRQIGSAAEDSEKKVKKFGDQLQFTATRLAAYYVAAGAFFRLQQAVGDAGSAVSELDKQVTRLTQIMDGNRKEANKLTDQVLKFSTAYGQSGREVLKIADILAQAGDKFGGTADRIANIAQQIAKTNLAATFGDIRDTTEGVIGVLSQFNLRGEDTTRILDLANNLAKKFAFEAKDMFEAVRAGGGAFALADNDIKNFAATVTALRSITRLTAAQVGTALNTISVRNLREDVIQFTEDLTSKVGGIRNIDGSLQGLTNRFIQVAKATKGFTDEQLGPIIEKLSDTRQAKFLIPLIRDIQRGSGASQLLKALEEAENSTGSLSRDAIIGLERIDVQLQSIGSRFDEVFKKISQDQGIKNLIKSFAELAKGSASVIEFLSPLLPVIAKIGTLGILLKAVSIGANKFASHSKDNVLRSDMLARGYVNPTKDEKRIFKQIMMQQKEDERQAATRVKTASGSSSGLTSIQSPRVYITTQQVFINSPTAPSNGGGNKNGGSGGKGRKISQVPPETPITPTGMQYTPRPMEEQRKNIAAFLGKSIGQNPMSAGGSSISTNSTSNINTTLNANLPNRVGGKFVSKEQSQNAVFVVKDSSGSLQSGFSPQNYKTPLFSSTIDPALPSVYRPKQGQSALGSDANSNFLTYLAVAGGQKNSTLANNLSNVASTSGASVNTNRGIRSYKTTEVGIATGQASRYLGILNNAKNERTTRQNKATIALTGNSRGDFGQDPALQKAQNQMAKIDNKLASEAGSRYSIKTNALALKQEYQNTIKAMQKNGASGFAIATAQGVFKRELEKLEKAYKSSVNTTRSLEAEQQKLKPVLQGLAGAYIAERNMLGKGLQQPGGRAAITGNDILPGAGPQKVNRFAASVSGLLGSGVEKARGFFGREEVKSGLKTAGGYALSIGASSIADRISAGASTELQQDPFVGKGDFNQNEINAILSKRSNLQKKSGFFSGVSSGAIVGAGIGSFIPGIGTLAGAAIGGIGGGIAGLLGSEDDPSQLLLGQQSSLNITRPKNLSAAGAAKISRNIRQRGLLETNIIRNITQNLGGKQGGYFGDFNAVNTNSTTGNILNYVGSGGSGTKATRSLWSRRLL